ncbi:MAG: hypothetical protein ACRD9Q_04030 [Nitrososphaeraceae archaeon]
MTHRMTKEQKELYSRVQPYLNANVKISLPQNSFLYHLKTGLYINGALSGRSLEVLVKDFNVSLHPKGLFIEP